MTTPFARLIHDDTFQDLNAHLAAGSLTVDYLRWSLEQDRGSRQNHWRVHTWVWIANNPATLVSIMPMAEGQPAAFLREVFIDDPLGGELMQALVYHKMPCLYLMGPSDIEKLVRDHADDASVRDQWTWIYYLLKSWDIHLLTQKLAIEICTRSFKHLLSFTTRRRSHLDEVNTVLDEIELAALPTITAMCLSDKKHTRPAMLVAAKLISRYPESAGANKLKRWLFNGMTPKNAANVYSDIAEVIGTEWPLNGLTLRGRVKECGWAFAKVKRTVILAFDDGTASVEFEARAAKWRRDDEDSRWEVMVPHSLLTEHPDFIDVRSCVTAKRQRYG